MNERRCLLLVLEYFLILSPLTNWLRKKKRAENQELGKSSSATTSQMGTLTNFIHQAVRYTATIREIELDISAKSQTSAVFYFAR
jgi:metal-dependent amidase/aminoacylase/carboxypeptidase family protein